MPLWLCALADIAPPLAETIPETGRWTSHLFNLGIALALVVANGFFVAAEFALVKVRPNRIDLLVEEGRLFAKTAQWLFRRLEQSLSGCQLGITMASLALGWVGEPAFAHLLEPIFNLVNLAPGTQHLLAFIIAFSSITGLHLVIGEQAPKIFAIRQPERMLLWCAVPMKIYYFCSYPLLVGLNKATDWLLSLIGMTNESGHEELLTETEVRAMVHLAHAHGELTRNERRLIDAIFEFDDLVCRRIMLPRHDVAWIDVGAPVEESLAMIRRTRHTRYPVCNGSLDNVLGILHIKDLLLDETDALPDFRQLARPPRKVPESMSVGKLLRHFQGTHQLMAFVIDEHGTVIGIVTLENVMEQIVGDVADEFDIEDPDVVPDGPGQYVASGGTPIDKLERELGVTFSAPDVDTLSGLLMQHAQEIVDEGDLVSLGPVEAQVLETANGRATRVRLTLPHGD